jgi:hypothetical protein
MDPIAKRYIDLVCDYTKIPCVLFSSKSRKTEIRVTRQLIMYFLQTHAKMTQANAGFYAGGMHHSTALSAKRRIQYDFDTCKPFREKYSKLFLMAQLLKAEIEAEKSGDHILKRGELCWFWRDGDDLPILRRFLEVDKAGKLAYAEDNFSPFTHWQFAEIGILPEEFRKSMMIQLSQQSLLQ